MKRHLRSFTNNGEQEDLHHFRTGVKKLRALLILADSTEKHPELEKHFKPVRKIFKHAGEIRNAHINQELGKVAGNDTDFVRQQQQIMENTTREFNANTNLHRTLLKNTRSVILKRIGSINKLHITLYYRQQLETIAASLTPVRFDESLHTCRKQMKVLLYNYPLARPELEIPFNEPYLDRVQAAIGDWHDNELAITIFSASGIANSNSTLSRLKKQSAKLKKQLIMLTRDFREQATTVTELPILQID